MLLKRREFLKMGSLAAASFMLPQFLKALNVPGEVSANGKILVILQLTGGNDGLNTIIPVRNDIYYKVRPGIGIKREVALRLDDETGIHPELRVLKQLFDNGELAVLNNVGYPNPDKSHFRSMDIWQSASASNEYVSTGWIGRYLDETCPDCSHPTQALEIDDMLSLALKGDTRKAIAFKDARRLYQTSNEKFYKTLYDNHHHDNETVEYLYRTLGETISNASYIYDKSKAKATSAVYPNTGLGNDLKKVASLLFSDINTRVYYLSVGSFDTHVNQLDRQSKLFAEINDAVGAFTDDLKKNGRFNDVLILTLSEFGRRVAQNASGGTDHGTANPMLFISGALKEKGILNPLPDLTRLNDGDLIYSEDFRKVYATVLQHWLEADATKILGWKNGVYTFV